MVYVYVWRNFRGLGNIKMRHGSSNRRQRGRGGQGNQPRRGNNQRMQVFDSNGPDVRLRGTAHQVTEKYLALAKDATSSGNIVLAESYLLHAEHYQRIINSWNQDQQTVSSDKKPEPAKAEDIGNSAKPNDEDLSLPASILGAEAKVESEERTPELSA